ncbi:MAG: serine/threonine-protein kinase [Planctomycetota bacterium]|jgi:serine/threonine-protein kinase
MLRDSNQPSAAEEMRFLAKLVHRGVLTEAEAAAIVPGLQAGDATLDELLVTAGGKDADWVERMRRTDGGEIPEIPGFEIVDRLGVGGTATVWQATELKTGREMALKVLRADIAAKPAELKAFVEETRLLERLDHPNLLKGIGVAKYGQTVFSKLEFVEGETLLEILGSMTADHDAMPEKDALGIVLETARALEYLESEGIVHRDIKPGNIMYTEDCRVVLIDLGFAAEAGAAGKRESGVGTVAYLSPEQARGGASADSRSDIYSLGVSLFQLVIGRLPFDSSDDREILRMQVMDSLSSPELRGRNFSPHLSYFIEKMMAKEADHRYQSWSELIEDVAGQIEGHEDLDFSRGEPKAQKPKTSPNRPIRRQSKRPGRRRR